METAGEEKAEVSVSLDYGSEITPLTHGRYSNDN